MASPPARPEHPPDPLVIHDGLAIYRIGDGPPILLMPGPHRFQQPGDGSASPLIAGLTRLGRQVVSFDPPGAGRSSRPARVSMAEMHDCADEALAAAGVDWPVAAIGHSMGGLAVLAYAIERPDRVGRLVLVGTGTGGRAYMHAPGALWNRSHPGFWQMAALGILQMAWRRRAPELWLFNVIRRQSFVDARFARTTPVAWRDWLRPRLGRTDWHQVARRLDYGPRLGEIAVPTLILCGRHDPQYPPSCSEELAGGIRRSQVRWFERSGHFPFVEEPDRFWRAVDDFLGPPAS
jgi:proline iminopeptidase